MIAKKHIADGRRMILAICDDELIGKKIVDGKRQLDVSTQFYGGEKLKEEEIIELIRVAYIVNAAGKNSVSCCIAAGICSENEAPSIKGVPYFQAVLV